MYLGLGITLPKTNIAPEKWWGWETTFPFGKPFRCENVREGTLLGINISHQKSLLKMIFLFPRWHMLVPWRVIHFHFTWHFPHVLLWWPGRLLWFGGQGEHDDLIEQNLWETERVDGMEIVENWCFIDRTWSRDCVDLSISHRESIYDLNRVWWCSSMYT